MLTKNNLQAIKSGIFGVVVGDALGVPVEFSSRSERKVDISCHREGKPYV